MSGFPAGYSVGCLGASTVYSSWSLPPARSRLEFPLRKSCHVPLDTWSSSRGIIMLCQKPVGCVTMNTVGYPHRVRPSGIGVNSFRRNSPSRTVSGSILTIFLVPSFISVMYLNVISPHAKTSLLIVKNSGRDSRSFSNTHMATIRSSRCSRPKPVRQIAMCCFTHRRKESKVLGCFARASIFLPVTAKESYTVCVTG